MYFAFYIQTEYISSGTLFERTILERNGKQPTYTRFEVVNIVDWYLMHRHQKLIIRVKLLLYNGCLDIYIRDIYR